LKKLSGRNQWNSYVRIAGLGPFWAATSLTRPNFSKIARGKFKFSKGSKEARYTSAPQRYF